MSELRAHIGAVATVARRELAGYFHAPIAYVVGVLFLVLQGVSFWAVVSVLADPARPAPLGAVLRSHFGGTLLHWAVLVLVVAVISMRLVAEDRRQGTWESLLTAPVDEAAVIAGKYLGGLAFYALLWLPTLMFPIILHGHAPPGAAIDVGPIASAYLGIVLCGMALLAVGLAASAATSNQIIAAVVTFVAAMLLLLVGEVPELAPGWLDDHERLRAAIAHVGMRGHMDALARGLVSSAAVVFYASVALLGLWTATAVSVWGRRGRRELRGRWLAVALVSVSLVCINVLAARHPARWDVTAARVNSLEPRTERILAAAGSGEPVQVTVVRAGLDIFAGVQAEVDRLLARMVATQPALRLEQLDPALAPGRLEALAAEFAIPIDNLRDGGVVVFQRGTRRRAVDLLDMAGFDTDDLGVGTLARFRAEEAFAGAISEVIDPDRPRFCHSVGHGEMALDAGAGADPGPSWAALARRIERDGGQLEAVDALAAGVPPRCRVLIVAGPTRPLDADESMAVARFLARGGRVLVALSEVVAGASAPAPGVVSSGLAPVLAEYGVAVPRAAVVDASTAVSAPGQWYTTDGYGEHAITSSFQGRRLTLWLHPRAVVLADPPRDADALRRSALVASSASGWGETDLAALAQGRAHQDAGDLDGPVSIAAAVEEPATGARLVVMGGAYSLSSAMAEAQGNELLAWAALAWLSGRDHDIDIGAKTPEHVRLIMSRDQLRRTFVVCVVLLPGLFALWGGIVWWRRRRA